MDTSSETDLIDKLLMDLLVHRLGEVRAKTLFSLCKRITMSNLYVAPGKLLSAPTRFQQERE